jgi:hypothetical protein
MWMKNGERCYARWLIKDHASRGKPVAQHHSRRFCRQHRRHAYTKKRTAEAGRFSTTFSHATLPWLSGGLPRQYAALSGDTGPFPSPKKLSGPFLIFAVVRLA